MGQMTASDRQRGPSAFGQPSIRSIVNTEPKVLLKQEAVGWNYDRHGIGRTTVPSRRSALHTVSVIPIAISSVRSAY